MTKTIFAGGTKKDDKTQIVDYVTITENKERDEKIRELFDEVLGWLEFVERSNSKHAVRLRLISQESSDDIMEGECRTNEGYKQRLDEILM